MATVRVAGALKRALVTLVREAPTYLVTVGAFLVVVVALDALPVLLDPGGEPGMGLTVLVVATGLLAALALVLGYFAALAASWDRLQGEATGPVRVLGRHGSRIPAFAGTSFVLAVVSSLVAGIGSVPVLALVAFAGYASDPLAIATALVPLMVLGFYPYAMWFVAPLVAIVEDHGVRRSLGRSQELTGGSRWTLLGILMLFASPILVLILVAPEAGSVGEAATQLGLLPPTSQPLARIAVSDTLLFVAVAFESALTAVVYEELTEDVATGSEGPAPVDAVLTPDEPEGSGGSTFEVVDRDESP